MVKLFEPYVLRNIELKNRIVMAPMCMYEAKEDGFVQPFHVVHYASRAMGQVGLVMLEATAVDPQGRISANDLGIWSDEHIAGLTELVQNMKAYNVFTAIQLAHAGRKATVNGPTYAPSAIAFDEKYKTPLELTTAQISDVIQSFKQGAIRAVQAGFDVLEIHAAHGYLLNEFLSPLTNHRADTYGGSSENRYRIVREVIDAIRSIWDGPLLVRVSAKDYVDGGLEASDYVQFGRWMASQGVDLVDVSTGAVVPATINAFPLYQVPYAKEIKEGAKIATSAVGLITTGTEAEAVLQQGAADLIFIGRELLRDPYFPYRAATELGVTIDTPIATYKRGW